MLPAPVIVVVEHEDHYQLCTQSSMFGLLPAGERLSRSPDFQVGQTRFPDAASARQAQERLEKHLQQYYQVTKPNHRNKT